ncbi:serine hydrolase domain-containing protein [uncultured Parasphingorhabdus sp.]|uniref:serine hydrolase domain-containing protein n=1 Tax=uncultured Parasphingorhabdus sp. TaxID=2709694 RepID=UPI0030D85079
MLQLDLQKTLDQALADRLVAGAVAMIGNADAVLASAQAGLADPETGKPMALDGIFQIASMTKAITSVAAMQLVERGLLSLDDPIDPILPELANPDVLTGFDGDGKAIVEPAKKAITLRHLLTHTSGLGYAFTKADMAKAQGKVAPASIASITTPLMFEPGTDWLYGVSTDWLGRAVEAASGQTLGAYMEDHIFAPLAMQDTGFAVAPDKVERRVPLLSRQADALVPFPIEIGGGDAAEYQSGGGGLYSTAADYMRFMRMILNRGSLDGVRIISAETVAAMSKNQIGGLKAGQMESVVPLLANSFEAFPGMHCGWGLGFLINPETGPDGRAAGSLSWAGLTNCYYWIDPASNIAGLVLMQFLPFADTDALRVLAAVESAAYQRT